MLYAQAAVTNAAGQVAEKTGSQIADLIGLIITKIPLWIAAFIVIIGSVVLAKIVRRIVINKLAEKGVEDEHEELQILGGRLSYSIVLTIGITVGLKIAGIDLTAIIAAAAFGVGFALKDLIVNFLAGIMLLVNKHFTIGDFIDVGGTVGKVVEIQSRVTVLQAIDGTKVVVPNADLFKKQVTSFTSNPFRRIEITSQVDYRTNLENAIKVTMKSVKETKGILHEPKPAVIIDEFADNGIILKIRAWVDSKSGWIKIKSNLSQNIKKNYDAYGIVIPWPIYNTIEDKDIKYEEKMYLEPQPAAEILTPVAATQAAPDLQPQAPLQPAAAIVITQAEDDDEQPLKPLGEK